LKWLIDEVCNLGWMRGSLKFLVYKSDSSELANRILEIGLKSDFIFEKLIKRLAMNSNKKLLPERVYAESTNACNAECIMCPRDAMTRNIGIMDFDLFKRITDQIVQLGVKELRFHNYGEAMIDPKIGDKIKYAKQAGVASTAMYTNGSLLNRSVSAAILESGLDKMFVSIDGTNKESFERIRLRLDYDEVVDNLRNFLEMKKEQGCKKPYTEIVLLPIEANNGDIEAFKKSWDGLIDKVRVSVIHDFAGQGTEQFVPEVSTNGAPRTKRIPCSMLWRDMYILWNGNVTLCCLDFDGKTRFGNVQSEPVKVIWQGENMQSVRKKHLKNDWQELPLCKNCHVNVYWDLSSKLETLRLWL
jgi:radical SAM protein with 4Fe4S-binding SPASM domain